MNREWTSEIDASFARAVCDRLDAMAAFGAERRPASEGDAPWSTAGGPEEHLREAVDHLLRLDGSASRVIDEARRVAAGLGDVKRAWSVALLLGSAAGDEAAGAAAATLRSPRADLRAAAADAVVLGTSPALGPALARLADDAPPSTAAAALGALRARRQASLPGCALLLGHPEASVAAAAARCLATVPERRAAAALLRAVLGDDPEEPLAVAAAESLLALGDPTALAFVRGELTAESTTQALSEEARVALLRLLALGGEAADLELFFRSLEPSPRDALAVGWFGHADLVEWLLGSLETATEVRRAGPRSRSSATLAGASAFEAAAAQALARIAGAPESMPPPGLETSAWRAWWGRARARLAPAQKHRFGRPYTPEITLEELSGAASAAARADAALELSIVTAGACSLEPADWVTRQKAVLQSAAEHLRAAPAWPPGAFPGRRLSR